jgi:hypothetical protein
MWSQDLNRRHLSESLTEGLLPPQSFSLHRTKNGPFQLPLLEYKKHKSTPPSTRWPLTDRKALSHLPLHLTLGLFLSSGWALALSPDLISRALSPHTVFGRTQSNFPVFLWGSIEIQNSLSEWQIPLVAFCFFLRGQEYKKYLTFLRNLRSENQQHKSDMKWQVPSSLHGGYKREWWRLQCAGGDRVSLCSPPGEAHRK